MTGPDAVYLGTTGLITICYLTTRWQEARNDWQKITHDCGHQADLEREQWSHALTTRRYLQRVKACGACPTCRTRDTTPENGGPTA